VYYEGRDSKVIHKLTKQLDNYYYLSFKLYIYVYIYIYHIAIEFQNKKNDLKYLIKLSKFLKKIMVSKLSYVLNF